MIKVIKPTIGETIYDGACGSAGFLCEVARLSALRAKWQRGGSDHQPAQHPPKRHLLRQREEEPRLCDRDHEHDPARYRCTQHSSTPTPWRRTWLIFRRKTATTSSLPIPPLAAKSGRRSSRTSLSRPGETAFLFLQHFIKYLRAGGRAAVVIKNTFLSNSDNASKALRQELLESCNLHHRA